MKTTCHKADATTTMLALLLLDLVGTGKTHYPVVASLPSQRPIKACKRSNVQCQIVKSDVLVELR